MQKRMRLRDIPRDRWVRIPDGNGEPHWIVLAIWLLTFRVDIEERYGWRIRRR